MKRVYPFYYQRATHTVTQLFCNSISHYITHVITITTAGVIGNV